MGGPFKVCSFLLQDNFFRSFDFFLQYFSYLCGAILGHIMCLFKILQKTPYIYYVIADAKY